MQATLTPDQRNDLQYSLQVILSRTLYEPTVKSPSTPPSPRSNRRSTLNLVSPKLELDEETQKWLAHEYRLGEVLFQLHSGGPIKRKSRDICSNEQLLQRTNSESFCKAVVKCLQGLLLKKVLLCLSGAARLRSF